MIQDENTSHANALTRKLMLLHKLMILFDKHLFLLIKHTLIPKNNLLSKRLAMVESGESKQSMAEDKGSNGMGKKKLRSASF